MLYKHEYALGAASFMNMTVKDSFWVDEKS